MRNPRFRYVALSALLTESLASTAASADNKAACLEASSQAQTLRDGHKLLEARERLRACVQTACPSVVRRDCATWLDEVDRSVPTVVLSLKDGAGHDVLAAHVKADGKPFADALTGAAMPIDPGAHLFRFELADGTAVEQEVLVGEGQRDLVVTAHLLAPPPSAPVPPSVAPGLETRGSSWRTIGWVVGGVGVAGLVVGSVFAGLAVSDKANGSCDARDRCANYGAINDAKTAADVADIGLIAGGVLAAGGASLVIFGRTTPTRPTTAWATVTPTVGAGGPGLVLRGGF